MTSSTRCSSSGVSRAAALLLVAALAGAGCAHRARNVRPGLGLVPGQRARIVLLPIDNVAGVAAPTKDLILAVEVALRRKFDLVSGDILEEFLARHRLRYTGGLDVESARAARDELGADAVLITSLELYQPNGTPAFGMTMRLVSTGDEPVILWMDAASHAGDEAPGLFRLGIVSSLKPLQDRVIGALARGLTAYADRGAVRRPGCGGAWYGPKIRFRSALLDDPANPQPTLAVIPFLNQGGRRASGDTLALEFVRHLVSTGRFRVLEPGVVRDFLLRARVIMPGGVSLEATRIMLASLGVDLVLSGVVLDYDESVGPAGPNISFTATMLDGGTGEIVWQSGSHNRGDDGVFAFGLGRVATSGDLACRMVGDVVAAIDRRGSNTPQPPRDDEFRKSLEKIWRTARRGGAPVGAGSGGGSPR